MRFLPVAVILGLSSQFAKAGERADLRKAPDGDHLGGIPPYRNWKSYAESPRDYADGLVEKYPLPDGVTFATWFKKNHQQLRKNRPNAS